MWLSDGGLPYALYDALNEREIPHAHIGGSASLFFNCSLDTLSLCLPTGLWMQLLRVCVCWRSMAVAAFSFHRKFGAIMSPWLITHNASRPRKGLDWLADLNVSVCTCECWRGTVQRSDLFCQRVGLLLSRAVGVFGEQFCPSSLLQVWDSIKLWLCCY